MAVPYNVLKRFSRTRGLPITKCLALSKSNDPFYVGAPAHNRHARWARWIYRLAGCPIPVHVRRLHYWAAAKPDINRADGRPYTNSPGDWDLMHHACKYARYLGLIPFEVFEDRRNAQPILFSELQTNTLSPSRRWVNTILSGLTERMSAELAAKHQPYHVEVWLEKSSVLDEVLPVARERMVNIVASLGEMSLTAVVGLVRRIVSFRKPARVFYISDFDPAGRSMPVSVARKLEYLLRHHRASCPSIKLCPVMLTPSQCVRYSLPRTPIRSSNRKARFESCHGPGAVELDALAALHPGSIGRILDDALACYTSKSLAGQIRSEIHKLIPDLSQKLTEQIRGWIPVLGTCNQPSKADHGDLARSWLYDSARGYLCQLSAYRRYLDSAIGLTHPDARRGAAIDGAGSRRADSSVDSI